MLESCATKVGLVLVRAFRLKSLDPTSPKSLEPSIMCRTRV